MASPGLPAVWLGKSPFLAGVSPPALEVYITVPLFHPRYLDEQVGLWLLFLALEMVSRKKLGFWEIPSEFSQMDHSSLLRHLTRTEAPLA